MQVRAVVALAAAVLAGAGCASSPPTARSVAARIPGCHPRPITDVSVYATAEVTCDIGAGVTSGFRLPLVTVWVATFASASLERSWLLGTGTGSGLPPGGCVEGNGWAADIVYTGPPPAGPVYVRAAHAAGGRIVSSGWCY